MLRIAVLISGGGTNLQAIIDATENKIIDGQVVQVVSNKKKAFGLERAQKHGIPAAYIGKGSHPDPDERCKALIDTMAAAKPDLIVLAGYLAILHPDFIKAFEDKIINIHPSLIPKYSGMGYYGMKVHEGVLENSEEYSGATVHFVDEDVDTGQIILQESIRLQKDETPQSLQKRVLEIEHRILVRSIQKFCDKEL